MARGDVGRIYTRTDSLSIEGEYLPRVAIPSHPVPDQQISGRYLLVDRLILHSNALKMSETPSVVKKLCDRRRLSSAIRPKRREAPGHGRAVPSAARTSRPSAASVCAVLVKSGTHSALELHRAPKFSVPARQCSIDLATVSLFVFPPQRAGRSTA